MPAPAFVQVRLPAKHLVLGQLTRRRGASAQAIVESVPARPSGRAFRVWAMLDGVPEETMDALATELEARYGAPPRLAAGGRVVFDVRPQQVQDGFSGALLALQASFGPPWLQVAGGRLTLRAQGLDCEPADCARRLKRTLALAEVAARVDVVTPTDSELAALQALEEWRRSAIDEDLGLVA